MFSTLSFIGKWKQWYRVLRYRKGFGLLDSVRYGLWLVECFPDPDTFPEGAQRRHPAAGQLFRAEVRKTDAETN